MASLLNVAASEVVLLPNATTGVNIVLRNLRWEKGDVILHFSTLYGACVKTVSYICESTEARSSVVDLKYPMKDEEVIERFRESLRKVNRQTETRVRVAIFDTVTSLPGVRLPWEILCSICREEGVLSLIDGAHGIGHIPIDLGEVKPDFFVSNCHKCVFHFFYSLARSDLAQCCETSGKLNHGSWVFIDGFLCPEVARYSVFRREINIS